MRGTGKQVILALAVVFVAGCGGSKQAAPTAKTVSGAVDGSGFRFEAPVAWRVARTARSVSAASRSELLSVTVFPLSRPYRPALRPLVAKELDRRIADLSGRLGGRLRSVGTAEVDGRWTRVYEIEVAGRVKRLLYLFRNRLEYQLLCEFRAGDRSRPCERLAATFRLA